MAFQSLTSTPTETIGVELGGRRSRRWGKFDGRMVIIGVVVLLVTYFAIVPLVFLLSGTFSDEAGAFSLEAFARAYSPESGAGTMFVNSLIFSIGSAVVALAIGAVFAFIQARTDAPGKTLLFAGSMVPLIIPGVLYASAWVFLAEPTVGFLNTTFFLPVFGTPVDVFGMAGMIWVEGTHMAPLAFLLMVAAFENMDPSLEESALMSGAKPWKVLFRVTLPLVRPAFLAAALLMFVRALSAFEVPALLGMPEGIYVFTSRIYQELRPPVDYAAGGAYSLTLLVVAVAGVLLVQLMNRNSKNYQTIGGKAFRPRRLHLGKWRPVIGILTVVYFLVAVALPVGALALTSVMPRYQAISGDALSQLTLKHWGEMLSSAKLLPALGNSFMLAVGAACIVMLLTAIAAWVVVRTRFVGRKVIDALAFVPLVVPGIVLGVALLFVYLRLPVPVYGTLLILLIAFITINLPYGMQYASGAMRQISSELEESATVFGATWWMTFRRVLLPLASGGLVAGWIYVAIISFRELSAAVLLTPPGEEVIAKLIWDQYEVGSFTELSALGVLTIGILTVVVAIAYKLGAGVGLRAQQ